LPVSGLEVNYDRVATEPFVTIPLDS